MITLRNMIFGYNQWLDSRPFIIRVKTDNVGTSASNQFTLPLQVATGLTYDYFVDWGDGEFTSHNTNANVTHTFPSAGIYDIKIYGKFEKIYFNNLGDKSKLLKILQIGDNYGKFPNQNFAFYGCANLTEVANDCDNLNNYVTDAQRMFQNCGLIALPSTLTFNSLVNGFALFAFNKIPTSNLTLLNATNLNAIIRDNVNYTGVINVGSQSVMNVASLAVNNKFNQDMSSWNFNKDCIFSTASYAERFTNVNHFSNENYGKLLIRINEKCGAGKGRVAIKNLGLTIAIKCPSFAIAARDALIADGWDIYDGGLE